MRFPWMCLEVDEGGNDDDDAGSTEVTTARTGAPYVKSRNAPAVAGLVDATGLVDGDLRASLRLVSCGVPGDQRNT